jgi:hypothetical protein
MSRPSKHETDKDNIRTELLRLAHEGETVHYRELGIAVGRGQQGPWTTILDEISLEPGPDITFLVLNGKTGWPSRIMKKFTDGKPSPEQMRAAQSGMNDVFLNYCPSKTAPTLPRPRPKSQRKRKT